MFKDGDYVIDKRDGKLGTVFYVDTPLYGVNWLSTNRKVSIGNDLLNQHWLNPAPLEIDEKSRDQLFMDLALLTKDYAWAAEISTSKLKK